MLLRKGLFLVPLLALFACAAADGEDGEEVGNDESNLAADQVVGTLSYGEQRSFSHWENGNKYSGVTFKGTAGDDVEILVHDSFANISTTGLTTPPPFRQNQDPIAYLEAPSGRVIARNDNASPTTKDAVLKARLPRTGTYTIAFRDVNKDVSIYVDVSLRVTMNSCAHPRISKRGQLPATAAIPGCFEFDKAAAAGNLTAIVKPSPSDCGHVVDFVDRANVWSGSLYLSQEIPNNDSFVDANGAISAAWLPNAVTVPPSQSLWSCKGRLNAGLLELECNGRSACKMSIPLR